MSKLQEIIVYGPPGTGKTAYIRDAIEAISVKRSPADMACVSFTKAAAKELAGRVEALPKQNCSTLHGFAFRALKLSREQVAESHLKEWNEANAKMLEYFIAGDGPTIYDPEEYQGGLETPSSKGGDGFLSAYNIARARLTPLEQMKPEVRSFADRWETWKKDNGYYDFTDFITLAWSNIDSMPENPRILFADEYQDFTELEQLLINKWSAAMEMVIKVGDSNQAIYEFKGVRAESLLEEADKLPDMNKRVLDKSHTLPAAIYKMALKWVSKLKYKADIEFAPRPGDPGKVQRASSLTYRNPDKIIDLIEPDLEQEQSIMLLASCSYMLNGFIERLKDAGIPFSNIYRANHGAWNPLQRGSGVGAIDRFLAYLRPRNDVFGDNARFWSLEDVHRWGAVLEADKCFERGGKKALEQLAGEDEITFEQLSSIFQEEALERFFNLDIEYYREVMLEKKRKMKVWEFLFQVEKKRGAGELLKPPLVTVGTIHSVKGGRADHVIIAPDLSQNGMFEYLRNRDPVIRQFYVGMTRSRSKLTILGAANYDLAVNLF